MTGIVTDNFYSLLLNYKCVLNSFSSTISGIITTSNDTILETFTICYYILE